MKCKNCPLGLKKYYTGKEPSPKGLGFCAGCMGEEGKRKKGTDGLCWVTKKRSGGALYWAKTVTAKKTIAKKAPAKKSGPKPCAAGKIRNPKTGRCINDPSLRKKSAAKKPAAKKSVASTGGCLRDLQQYKYFNKERKTGKPAAKPPVNAKYGDIYNYSSYRLYSARIVAATGANRKWAPSGSDWVVAPLSVTKKLCKPILFYQPAWNELDGEFSMIIEGKYLPTFLGKNQSLGKSIPKNLVIRLDNTDVIFIRGGKENSYGEWSGGKRVIIDRKDLGSADSLRKIKSL